MGWAYSVDLRERVVSAFDIGDMTDEEAATLFQVGEATVHRWKRLKRETGSLVPRPPRGGGMLPRVAAEQYELVRAIVSEQPDVTIPEAAWEFHRRTGRSVSPSAMGRTLRKLGLTRKKSP
jgi:transposase